MSNNELMGLIVSTGDDTSTLISVWGLAFYFRELTPIIYKSNLFGINVSFNMTNFTGLAEISITNIIILKNLYRIYKYN